jgi:hypothetical protein
MAKKGVLFTHYYSPQAVCSTSRAGLMTGCYPNRVGFSVATNPDNTQFTTQFTERAVRFIRQNKSNPFFLYLAKPAGTLVTT